MWGRRAVPRSSPHSRCQGSKTKIIIQYLLPDLAPKQGIHLSPKPVSLGNQGSWWEPPRFHRPASLVSRLPLQLPGALAWVGTSRSRGTRGGCTGPRRLRTVVAPGSSGVRGRGARDEKVENDLQWKAAKAPVRVYGVITWSAFELEEWEVGRDLEGDEVYSFGDKTSTSGPDSGLIPTTRSIASEFPTEKKSAGATHSI